MIPETIDTTFVELATGAGPKPTVPAVAEQHNGNGWVPALLQQAIEKGASLDIITKLMDHQDRWDATQARKAFNIAFTKAQAEFPVIKKDKEAGFKSNRTQAEVSYTYESLGGIERAIRAPLAKYGLSSRWRVVNDHEAGTISVTHVLAHELGHFEENTLHGEYETSGTKNRLQSMGSAETYLMRYTVKPALGLATEDDDDGRGSGDEERKRPRPPKDNEPVSYLIPSAGRDPVEWADEYKKGLAGATSKKELAQWARDNAVALSRIAELDQHMDPHLRACAYLRDEIEAAYKERLDILDGKEPKAAAETPPHDPETGEIIEPKPGEKNGRPRPPKDKDPVQKIMALKDGAEVFQYMKDHPTMSKADYAALTQRKKELGID